MGEDGPGHRADGDGQWRPSAWASGIADRLGEWFTIGVYDGFVIAATHLPGTYMELVRHLVPERQRRGLHHEDYTGATPREKIGPIHGSVT